MKLMRWTMFTLLGLIIQCNAQAAQGFNGICPTTLVFKTLGSFTSSTIVLSGSQGTAFNDQASASVTLSQSNPTQTVYLTNRLPQQSNSYTVNYAFSVSSFTIPLGTLTFTQLGDTCYTTNTPSTFGLTNKVITKLALINPLQFQFLGMVDGQNIVLATLDNLPA